MFLFFILICILQNTQSYPNFETNKILIITVLGCNIEFIQNDRVNVALEYISHLQNTNNVYLFLTGGFKNKSNISNPISEASKMAKSFNFSNIIIDDKASNTAENFKNLNDFIIKNIFSDFIITVITSKYHQERASLLFSGFFNFNPIWILGNMSCSSCWNDEIYHIKNVNNDILNAINK